MASISVGVRSSIMGTSLGREPLGSGRCARPDGLSRLGRAWNNGPVTSADDKPTPSPARRPASVYGVGTEPDIRFSLANERTALAWLRTGLGLVAGGVALTGLAGIVEVHLIIDIVAVVACLAGALAAPAAGWDLTNRLNQPLPGPAMLPALVAGLILVALVLAGFAAAELF